MLRFSGVVLALCLSLHAESVLVLPFFNHSKPGNLDWVGESISEAIVDALASEGVLALDRADRMEAYRRLTLRPGAELTHASIIKLGQALDASSVIYGQYEVPPAEPGKEQTKSRLVITARVLELKHMHQGPEMSEHGVLQDLAPLETHLGWQALAAIRGKSAPSEQDFVKARPPVRIDAVENYIRGLMSASTEQRNRFFAQAAKLDDHYSPPSYQLGKSYWEKKDHRSAAMWLDRVARSDPHYLESRFFLGLCKFQTGDYAAAEQAFQVVAASVPLNEVYNNLGAAQARMNHLPEAIASFQKALEGDDADPDYHFNLGYALLRSGRSQDAAERFRAVLARTPSDAEATTLLGRSLNGEKAARDPKGEARERLKTNYDEAAYRQLEAELKKE
jgi:tetratricopeptide (TPR) repeat protein